MAENVKQTLSVTFPPGLLQLRFKVGWTVSLISLSSAAEYVWHIYRRNERPRSDVFVKTAKKENCFLLESNQ